MSAAAPRAAGFALLAGLLLGAPASAAEGGILAVLERRGDDARTREQVLDQLAELGEPAVAELFALFRGEGPPFRRPSAKDGGEERTLLWCSPDETGRLALDALERLPADDVVRHLQGFVRGDAEDALDAHLAAARVVERVGSPAGADLVLELVGGTRPAHLASRGVRGAFVGALVRCLREGHGTRRHLVERVPELSPTARLLLAEAARGALEPDAVALLRTLLGTDAEVDLVSIRALADLGQRFPWRLEELTGVLHLQLGHASPAVRAAAAQGLGGMRDASSVDALVHLLADAEREPRKAAQWALERMSGLESCSTKEEWKRWHARETAWWDAAGEGLLEDLRSDSEERVARAARELTRHPLFHPELAEALGEQLAHMNARLLPRMLATLESIDGRRAVPGLLDLMRNLGNTGRSRGLVTLRALTGEDFQGGMRSWEQYVNG